MIGPADVEFHAPPPDAGFRWAETSFFPFAVPEAGISGAVYCLFRPNLGVMMCDVTIMDRISRSWEGQAYVDNQQHLPCPQRLSDFTLPNGFSLKALDGAPRNFHVRYEGIDDTRFAFDFRGIMAPQDINDPAQDPLTRRKRAAQAEAGAWDGAFGGHFEMTGRARGELVLRGKRYPIDSLGTMDHSWGPRAERDNTNAVWFQAHFGEDLVLHALCSVDPRQPEAIGPLWHGYVLRHGVVRGLVSATGRTQRQGLFAASQQIELVDEDGGTYALSGTAVNWAPWAPYPSVPYYQSLSRWTLAGRGDERVGYGPYQEVLSRAFITRHGLGD